MTIDDIAQQFKTDFRFKMGVDTIGMAEGFISGLATWQFESDLKMELLKKELFIKTCSESALFDHSGHNLSPTPGQKAKGSATLTGSPGAVIPVGTAFLFGEQRYISTAEATLAASDEQPELGSVTLPVEAEAIGSAYNRGEGELLTMVVNVSGVEPVTTATSVTGGLDDESVDSFSARVGAYYQRPQAPFNSAHIEAYVMSQVPAVIFARAGNYDAGPKLRALDSESTLSANSATGIAGAIADIAPIGIDSSVIEVAAPNIKTVNINVDGLTPATQVLRDSVRANILDWFATEDLYEKGVSASVLSLVVLGSTADGYSPTSFNVTVDGGSNAPSQLLTLPRLGELTFS